MKKKRVSNKLQLSKSSIAGLSDKKVEFIKGGDPTGPTFIPILCLVTYRSCTFPETLRTCPI